MGNRTTMEEGIIEYVESTPIHDVIPPQAEQPQAEIFKLKMDHFEELFDWLSLKDLLMLSQTCQRMKHIVGYYIKTSEVAKKFVYHDFIYDYSIDGITTKDRALNLGLGVKSTKFDGLSPFLRKLVFPQLERSQCHNVKQRWLWFSKEIKCCKHYCIPYLKADQFKSLTEIELFEIGMLSFTDKGISCIKEILGQLETVKLTQCVIHKDMEFYESFLQFCINIKKLCLFYPLQWNYTHSSVNIFGANNSWLLRKYSKLEYFELRNITTGRIAELQTFFEQNTTIKTFATNMKLIRSNSEIFKNINSTWNVLSVVFEDPYAIDTSLDLLSNLYEREHFQHLHLHIPKHIFFQQSIANQMTSLSLIGLTIGQVNFLTLNSSPFRDLKHLWIGDSVFNVERHCVLAKTLINLEFISFEYRIIDDILPFIRYSAKLKTIDLRFSVQDYEEFSNFISLEEQNNERSKLRNARKIIIYIPEEAYLLIKWRQSSTSCGLIEIRRNASHDTGRRGYNYLY